MKKTEIEILSFNIQHGRGMDGKVDLERAARIIEKSGATVVGLQEVDKYFAARSQYIDQIRWLGERLGMNIAFGGNIQKDVGKGDKEMSEYGNALLTTYPITKTENHHLTLNGNGFSGEEQRGLLEVEIDVNGQLITIFNTHIALEEIEKTSNVKEIITIAQGAKRPRILIGDFNALSDSEQINRLKEVFCDVFAEKGEANSFTFPSPYEDTERWMKSVPAYRIDYIFADTKWMIEEAGRIITDVSDHLPIRARFSLK